MRLRNRITGKVTAAVLTTEHGASSHQQPVLVVDGNAYVKTEASILAPVVVSVEEAEALRRAGYGAILGDDLR